eukprot:11294236-Alexandrium_andersonii.AAC.1
MRSLFLAGLGMHYARCAGASVELRGLSLGSAISEIACSLVLAWTKNKRAADVAAQSRCGFTLPRQP